MSTSMDQFPTDLQREAAELSPTEVSGRLLTVSAFLTGLASQLLAAGSLTNARASDHAGEEYLTVEECARITKLTEQYIYEAIRKDELRAARIGDKPYVRVKLSDLEAWIWRKGAAVVNQSRKRKRRN